MNGARTWAILHPPFISNSLTPFRAAKAIAAFAAAASASESALSAAEP